MKRRDIEISDSDDDAQIAPSPPKKPKSSRLCATDGCTKRAGYGPKGTRIRTHCAPHGKPLGFVDTAHHTCEEPGCEKIPAYGKKGTKEKTHCAAHGTPLGFVDNSNKRCTEPGCETLPTYGTERRKPIHCAAHKTHDERDVKNGKCSEPGCHTLSSFGTEWRKPIHCAVHKTDGERNVVTNRCIELGCSTIPVFGIEWTKPLHCAAHKVDGEHDVRSTRCTGRDGKGCYFEQRAYYGKCCAYCTADPKAGKIFKKTETRCIKAILRNLDGIAASTEQLRIEYQCTGAGGQTCAKIDLVLDHPSARVLLEIDERRHDGEEELCRLTRMHDATAELRAQSTDPRPIAWVRFNPDDGERQASAKDQLRRCGDAAAAVRELIANPRDDIVYVNY